MREFSLRTNEYRKKRERQRRGVGVVLALALFAAQASFHKDVPETDVFIESDVVQNRPVPLQPSNNTSSLIPAQNEAPSSAVWPGGLGEKKDQGFVYSDAPSEACDGQITSVNWCANGLPDEKQAAPTSAVPQPGSDAAVDPTLPDNAKWQIAVQLAQAACPSGSLESTGYALMPVFGDDTDGRLGVTNMAQKTILVDVRPLQRPKDIAVTIVHESTHAEDAEDRIDRSKWIEQLGVGQNTPWYGTNGGSLPPAESLAVAASMGLLGRAQVIDTIEHGAYPPNPQIAALVESFTDAQLSVAASLTTC